MPIVRIHKGEAPNANPLAKAGYRLGGASLVLVFRHKDQFGAYCQQHSGFKISTGVGNRIHIGAGKYFKSRGGGKSQQFDSLNYLHQRYALLGSFGDVPEGWLKVGPKGHRISLGNVFNKVREGAAWIESPLDKLAEAGLKKSLYFVVFSTNDSSRVMHLQEGLTWVMTNKKHFTTAVGGENIYITLGDAYANYKAQIEGFLAE